MTAMATSKTNRLATKVQMGAAAAATAAAAALAPLPVTRADPVLPNPSTDVIGTLGGAAGVVGALIGGCDPVTDPACVLALPAASPGINTIFQNPLWWFGSPNPNPPTQTTVFQF